MRLFGRKQPLHRALADAAGLSLGDGSVRAPGLSAAPPGWDGEQRGEPGIHGVPRARKWDAVVAASAPDLRGDAIHFVALENGTLIVEEDEPDGALTPLADALETHLAPPYRAEAVRRDGTLWGVGGRRITVVSEPGLVGEEAELVLTSSGWSLTVDGRHRLAHVPALEAAGRAGGAIEAVVRASRLDDDLWEVETAPL
ncbi:MAG TPA: hypothetical protein VLJ44_14115 [Gaiellaceae bacterium]|nr:hypothetical protein [Gaiellaceae bacterium]